MYLGHVALGLAAKRARPELPVLVLATATVALDLADIAVRLAGVVPPDPWTHTLPAALSWALALGLLARVFYDARAALLVAALVFSHLLLYYVTGRLEVWPGGPTIGFGLFAHMKVDFLVEGSLLFVGWSLYRRSLPLAARRHWAVWTMLGVLIALQGSLVLIGLE
jgi:hypothetical protein